MVMSMIVWSIQGTLPRSPKARPFLQRQMTAAIKALIQRRDRGGPTAGAQMNPERSRVCSA